MVWIASGISLPPEGGLASVDIALIDWLFLTLCFLLHSCAILAAVFVKSLNKV